MKVVSIVGARPQFIKCGPVSRELRRVATEVLVHTGQHYDSSMSGVFFRDLDLPRPDYHLAVGSGTHGWQTGEMLKKIEDILMKEAPDVLVVYGDTNSTLAGALAAAKLHVPIAHIEAGLRSFNRKMPEEINRVMTDHLAATLLCPTETAVKNLDLEGIRKGVHLVGDVMYDALWDHIEKGRQTSTLLKRLGVEPQRYLLATVHRAENTDQPVKLQKIVDALLSLTRLGEIIVLPVHPRTRKELEKLSVKPSAGLIFTDPLSYMDMMILEESARIILTDSGGVQKEAYWLSVPCITLREQTEWIETVESGRNRLVGTDCNRIVKAVETVTALPMNEWPWKRGEASKTVARLITE